MISVKTAIENGDVATLRQLLSASPVLANQHVVWGKAHEIRTHPLHFVSDKLFDGTLDRTREVEIAVPLIAALIQAGADVNHFSPHESPAEPKCETPLNGAASLGASEVGIRLLEAGAKTETINLLGETALHWAAALALDRLVVRILEAEGASRASLRVKDTHWHSTPLGWAMHCWFEPPPGSLGNYQRVVSAMVRAGAEVDPAWLTAEHLRSDPEKIAALRGE